MGLRSFMLPKREASRILDIIRSKWPGNPTFKTKAIRNVEIDEARSLLIGDDFKAVKISNEEVVPFLKMDDYLGRISAIVIDQGAIRFICNGANVMRPGIVRWEGEFQAGDIIAVKEAGHNKLIAVGAALVPSQDLTAMSKGVAVKNLHYVGDPFWEAYKTIEQPT